jgi:GAF domain
MHEADVTTCNTGGHFAGTSDPILASVVGLRRAAVDTDPIGATAATPQGSADWDMAQLTTMAAKLLAADGCMIMLIDSATRDPMTFRAYSIGLPACAAARKLWTRHGETAAREAIRAGKALLVDIPGGARNPDATMPPARPVHSIVASPIHVRNNIVGALSLMRGRTICRRRKNGLAAVEIAA